MVSDPTYCAYVLLSLTSKHRYVGMTADPARRLSEHNEGRTRSTTTHRPYRMIIIQRNLNRSDARRLERYYKSGFGRKALDRLLAKNVSLIQANTSAVADLTLVAD